MNKQRNYGLDLLKIIAMLFIIISHVISKGGIIGNTESFTIKYRVLWILETLSYLAVNVYAIISGYFGIDTKHRYKKLISLTLEVMFYTVLITSCFKLLYPELVSTKMIIQSFFPFAYDYYWYFTAYFGLFFFIPFIKKLVNNMNRRESLIFTTVTLITFSIIPILFREDTYFINWGYHIVWLAVLYMLGCCLKKFGTYRFIENNPKKTLFITLLITILSQIIIEYGARIIFDKEIVGMLLISYTSPTILIASIALVLVFTQINVKEKYHKLISFIIPLNFAVYLIHTEPLIWEDVLKDLFINYANLNTILLIFAVIVITLAIYTGCIIIDYIRSIIFKLAEVDYISEKLGSVIDKYLSF